ncbi:hypothetical protein CsatA_019730 [Cannabis sativa]
MWALPYLSPPPQLHLLLHPNSKTKTPRPVSANSHQPPQNDVGGLGRTILTALNSNSNSKPTTTTTPNPIPKREARSEEDETQISGSDVLWAMQKAAAKKNKLSGGKSMKKKKKKNMVIMSKGGLSSVDGDREEDLAGVRPLCIKTEWGPKLDELEKSLRELYQTK